MRRGFIETWSVYPTLRGWAFSVSHANGMDIRDGLESKADAEKKALEILEWHREHRVVNEA